MNDNLIFTRGGYKLCGLTVPLVKYDPAWRINYLSEKNVLEQAIPSEFIARVSHIGGTAVPGFMCEPVIDILLEVEKCTDLEWLEYKMLSLGYQKLLAPEEPVPHLVFIKGYAMEGFQGQPYHVHIRFFWDWDEIYFRDYLRMNPESVEAYSDLKWEFKDRQGEEQDIFLESESRFINLAVELERLISEPRYCIRRAAIRDIPVLKQLFKETLMTVNLQNYTPEEVADWASCGDNDERWEKLVYFHYTLIAEDEDANVLGFMALSPKGYLNSMFVHKDFQNQGIATTLYELAEKRVQNRKIPRITADVSLTAYPFFQKMGFIVEEKQSWKANKLFLNNYKMSKMIEFDEEEFDDDEFDDDEY